MRQIFFILMTLLLFFLIWNTQCNFEEQFDSKSEKQLKHHQIIAPKQGNALFDEINISNNKINSLQADIDLTVKLDETFRLTGRMNYSKSNMFRMTMNSFFGKELDVGSNEIYFWYWSKRGEPSALHYAKHKDIDRTKLKSPFNPKFILGSLGITHLDYENAIIDNYQGIWRVIKTDKNLSGLPITTCVMINPETKLIIGRSIYNSENKLIIASEIKTYQNINGHVVPKQIVMIWYEEDINLSFTLKQVSLNKSINQNFWIMPNINPKIDMSKD